MNSRGNSRGLTEAIANSIRERIKTGAYRAGEALPPERVLCEEFGVSRITIRRSLAVLLLANAYATGRRPNLLAIVSG